jgi:phosphopantothenoylcysteine decarboxylase/phosphopantothenate--cysteine ligase
MPAGITYVPVATAEEMNEAGLRYFPQSTLVIMAAAISDYRPKKSYSQKVKKDASTLNVELERTQDVLKQMGGKKKQQFLVGFALETENLEENARKKLKDKNLDMVVANGPAGLAGATNEVLIINREGALEHVPFLDKDEIADRILDRVVRLKSR